jgi:hypothetical protein
METALCRSSRVKALSVHADAFSPVPWASYPSKRGKRLRTAYFECAVFPSRVRGKPSPFACALFYYYPITPDSQPLVMDMLEEVDNV